jgi:hypothetical protein
MINNFFHQKNKSIGIGKEGLIHKKFANLIREYENLRLLNCERWSYDAAGEKRQLTTASLLKAKGLKRGHPDYSFICIQRGIAIIFYIEFKSGKNKQTTEQKDFELMCQKSSNLIYQTCYSPEEAINFLIKNGVIKNNTIY